MSWFGMWDGFDEECQNAPDLFAQKPKTNYDRIISKTPEELALWLSDIAEWLPHYAGKAHAILKWLEQEVTE